MNESAIDRLYEQGAESLRHYSSAILNIRNVAIAQGFAVLTAEAYLMKERNPAVLTDSALLTGAALFGICLTTVLYALQWNYKRYFDAILPAVVANERKLCGEVQGPWATYAALKSDRRLWWALYRLPTLHGLFLLLLLTQAWFYGVGLLAGR